MYDVQLRDTPEQKQLRVRLQPAGTEAFTRLPRAQGEFPGILDAYDAVGHWIDQKPMRRAGNPAEVYLGDRHSSDTGPDAPYVDVTWPARPA